MQIGDFYVGLNKNYDMFQSMTGYGKISAIIGNKNIEVEIRSLNSKQLDLNLHLPFLYHELEAELRSLISQRVQRGKVDVFINLTATTGAGKPLLNKNLAKQYHKQLKELAKAIGDKKVAYLPLILNMPGLFKPEEVAAKEELKVALTLVGKAVGLLKVFRAEEGKALKKDIESHLAAIVNKEKGVAKLDPARIEKIRNKMRERMKEAKEIANTDANRFEQELIYYIEKLDINEERTRLTAHCNHFTETMREENCGRKLGFIAQEIGREINTIGSKANDADIQKLVVEMKDELEKIKEQLLNVL